MIPTRIEENDPTYEKLGCNAEEKVTNDCEVDETPENSFCTDFDKLSKKNRDKDISDVSEENKLSICSETNFKVSNSSNELKRNPCQIVYLYFTMIYFYLNTLIQVLSRPLHKFCKANKKLLRIIGLLVVLILAFVQSRSNVGHHAFETQRLFSSQPLVTDYYYGELSLMKELIYQSEFTCVLYYAPWDRQCQNVVPHFIKTAAYHHEQVSFAAINCWLPGSECRSAYRLNQYPIVVLHIRITNVDDILTIPYDGPLNSHHLIKFIANAYRPMIHISTRAELLALKLEYQAIILGYFNNMKPEVEFLEFYYASINKLQFEHMNDVIFTLITNSDLATSLSFKESPSMQLVLFNSTMIYPKQHPWKQKNITSFINTHLTQLTKWLQIDGRKNSVLNAVLKGGPILAVFAPNNPYLSSNDPFRILHSTSMEYYNCQNSTLLRWLSSNLRMVTRSRIREMDQDCRTFLKDRNIYEKSLYHTFDPQSTKRNRDDSLCASQTSLPEPELHIVEGSNYISQITWNTLLTFIDNSPLSIKNFCNDADKRCSSSCRNHTEASSTQQKGSSTGALPKFGGGPIEDETIGRLKEWLLEEHCKKLVLGSAYDYPPVLKDYDKTVSVEGLGCQTNRTLNFVAIDSLLHADLAAELGLDLEVQTPRNTGAVIIDPLVEEKYILEETLSRNSLASFVLTYTNGLLNRAKMSTSESFLQQSCPKDLKCISELSASNYINVTQTKGKTYVVLHYSANCGACSALWHLFLAAIQVTANVDNLEFARIDISKNTLPWQLTFERVPTLIVFPANSKSESLILEADRPMSLQSLLLFLSNGLSEDQRHQLALGLCDSANCRAFVGSQLAYRERELQRELSGATAKNQRIINVLARYSIEGTNERTREIFLYLKATVHKKIQRIKKKLNRYRIILNNTIENSNQLPILESPP